MNCVDCYKMFASRGCKVEGLIDKKKVACEVVEGDVESRVASCRECVAVEEVS